jgi:hypothetical protein
MQDALEVIRILVAPVVMISAAGLICLALYNRLAAIVSRARAFHKERFDAVAKLSASSQAALSATHCEHLRKRIAALDQQVEHILPRAKLIRNALICLLFSVVCMLACSLALGISMVVPWTGEIALVLFLLGVLVMIVSVLLALVELFGALDPVALEASSVDDWQEC